MITTVILDWSGVVSDDWATTFKTANDVLEARGHERISKEKFKELYELPFINFYKKIGLEIDIKEEYGLWAKFFPKYFEDVNAFPFAKQAFDYLKSNGKKVIIFSASNQEFVEKEAKEYGFFDDIYHIDASNHNKLEKIDALVEAHEIEKDKTVYVGDMVHDIDTANSAGITSVAVLSGYDSKEKLEKAKPSYIIESIGELGMLLEKLDGEK